MDRLTYELNGLCDKNRDGSFQTQRDRKLMLRLFSYQLRQLGFKKMRVTSLKTKHVNRLLTHWKQQASPLTQKPISTGTIKNRLSVLRWWAHKINKQNIIPRSNKPLDIEDRQRIATSSKAYSLTQAQLNPLPRHIQLSLRLQQEFGLRREEAAKFTPHEAIKSNHIDITRSWAKGGRARTIPITTQAQRELIRDLMQSQTKASLIPPRYNYREYLMHREHILNTAGIRNTHGLRHYYAQTRYKILAPGLTPRIQGGKKKSDMNRAEKIADYQARKQISSELGHSRVDVTRIYLG